MFLRTIVKYCEEHDLKVVKYRGYYGIYDGDIWLGSYQKKLFKSIFGECVNKHLGKYSDINFTQFILQQYPHWLFRYILSKRTSFKFESEQEVNAGEYDEYSRIIYSYGSYHIVIHQRHNNVLVWNKDSAGISVLNDGIRICSINHTYIDFSNFVEISAVCDTVNSLLYALYEQNLIMNSSLHNYYDKKRRLHNYLYKK